MPVDWVVIPMVTVLDRDELWRYVDQERAGLADLLEGLSPEEWEAPTLCGDWRVRDVAAHLTVGPRSHGRDVLRELLRAHGDPHRMIHDVSVREGRRPVGEIVAALRSAVGSRRAAPGTTPHETLLDLLVHGQDIALALGREREMPPAAARDAAERVWTMRFPPRPWPRPQARLVATDIDWTRGEGEEVRAPVAALLLLLTGRPEAARAWFRRAEEPLWSRAQCWLGCEPPTLRPTATHRTVHPAAAQATVHPAAAQTTGRPAAAHGTVHPAAAHKR
ncbi:maleylpyruvate isomerase family mycothiol-dependent enzyme [Streptomyces sp. H51]|uniref:maleylpyruvate isomerase family mycothiol-dependent enzyme n=1 Tax=Streptomyces sp. H51 TaxID=3111770 RepID=UPI002D79B455|nr:maleylpyruvate isomerase family mycothiol-dependent enzyme [Streptomyces sp. H51]